MLEEIQKMTGLQEVRSQSATYIQGSAMAAIGEWRDKFCCLKLLFALLTCAVHLQLSYLNVCVGYTN